MHHLHFVISTLKIRLKCLVVDVGYFGLVCHWLLAILHRNLLIHDNRSRRSNWCSSLAARRTPNKTIQTSKSTEGGNHNSYKHADATGHA